MSKEKPSAPKGMRDFGPQEMARRNYIFNSIREVYKKYGYSPIETPAMEKLETLTGKYGDEGDRLIFKVLNSGDYLKDVKGKYTEISEIDSKSILKSISEKALRYDLTVPFARFVVQYQHQISFPFKRYQIQPVWRADNPQKGRYREFYQCDADVVGSDSLMNEIEFVQIFNDVLNSIKLHPYIIKINNRKVLSGMTEVIGISDRLIPFTIALDKLDKIGVDKVIEELKTNSFTENQLTKIREIIEFNGSNQQRIEFLKTILNSSETGMKGIYELETVLKKTEELGLQNGELEFDMTLARGLNYYTGCIFEVKIKDADMGSIAGGGRYDDLTGIFGLQGISGVGISFGADRIYDLLLHNNLFPELEDDIYQFLFLNFGEQESFHSLKIVHLLRKNGIRCTVYPDSVKVKKQMSYADSLKCKYVCTIGSNEIAENKIGVKNMQTGEQTMMTQAEFLSTFIQQKNV